MSNFSQTKPNKALSIALSKQSNIKQQSKALTCNKNMENVEYLLKVADKNKRQLQESYGKQVDKIEMKISKNEKTLSQVLQEINEKESHIFDVQKVKVEAFKNEANKFDKIKELIEDHLSVLEKEIIESKRNEKHLINQANMVYEDFLTNSNEGILIKEKLHELRETLKQVEKTYPKDFEFLSEDIQLEKELTEVEELKKSIQREIKQLEGVKVKLQHEKLDKEERKELVEVEFRKIDEQIEESYVDNHLKLMEDYLVSNISDLLVFNNLRLVLQEYYERKQFDIENEINVLTMKNLAEKLTEMKNEFYQTKNEKIMEQQKLMNEIEDLKNQTTNRTKTNALIVAEKIKQKQEEGEKLHNEITKLELNCKKKETLFNKYLILLRNKCTKTDEESYFKNNPSLILENNFEEELKDEMIAALGREKNYLTEEDLKKYEGTIDIYFRDLFERERTCQLILLQRTKIENNLKEHQDSINHIIDKIQETENEIKLKKMRFQEVNKNLSHLKQKIESRNRTLKFNLENLSESNFMDYLDANEEVLKSMKRIYGNKILSKVFKAQKEKFFENVMLDHSFKKNKINEFIRLTSQYQKTIEDFEDAKERLLQEFNDKSSDLEELKEHIFKKEKEQFALKTARIELMENIENMLINEIEDITNEKIKLRQKLNCDFYFVKVKELAHKIENLKKEKERILNEFFSFRDVIIQREQKLYKDDMEIKKQLMSLGSDDVNSDLLGSLNEKMHSPLRSLDDNFNMKSGTTFPLNSPDIPHQVNRNSLNQMCEKEENEEDIVLKKNLNEQLDSPPIENNKFEPYENNEEQQDFNKNEDHENENIDDAYNEDSQQTGQKSQLIETINLYEHKKLLPQNSDLKISIDKVKPFLIGLNIYKKLGSSKKFFDPKNASEAPPESCGYSLRFFQLSGNFIEIRKEKKIELKIDLKDLCKILITPQTRQAISKYKKGISTRPNSSLLISKQKADEEKEYVNFQLVLEKNCLDLIAHNYMTYISFADGIEEFINFKKNKTINEFLFHCYNN